MELDLDLKIGLGTLIVPDDRYVALGERAMGTDEAPVQGLSYHGDYLTSEEESRLIAMIDRQPWITDLKRRVQHYGYRYNYTHRRIEPDMFLGPLPGWAQPLAQRLHRDGCVARIPDQLIINIDCVPCFGDTILSISLGSPLHAELRPGAIGRDGRS